MRLEFGAFTLDVDSRQLLRDDREIHLSPKAFDLLTALIDARPRVLTKHELHKLLWPDTFVSDANLASLVAEVREALGDNAREPRFIRTAQRVGYAFCGQADRTAPAASAAAGFCWLIKDRQRLPLRSGENILGREDDEGGIRIESATVSRRHACIAVSAGSVTLEDLGSKNGTFLRGAPVTSATPLRDGDEIRVGSIVLRFRMASESRTATWTEP